MHTEYTTAAPGSQAPAADHQHTYTPIDLHDGAPSGYWVKDETGQVSHLLTADELPLVDRAPSGRVRPWRTHHSGGLMLAEIYASMAETGTRDAARYLSKAERLEHCACYAEFRRLPSGALRLHDSSFCRVRLCPMCQWRRSLKLGAQVRQVVERANAARIADVGAPWRWLMLTFTVRNVEGPDLALAIDTIHKGLNNMAKCARWRGAVKGWLRATEVTHNIKADTWHPHMHLLLCVPSAYFSGRGYIRQAEWAQLWGHYVKADYTPIVDVRPIKPQDGTRLSDLPVGEQAAAMGKACAEVSKYAAKPGDYIVPQDLAASMQAVALLDAVLDKRRMSSWGGCLKDIAKALQLDDPETGDLVHIDDEPSADSTAETIAHYITYAWALGARDYLPHSKRDGLPEDVERANAAAARAALKEGRRAQQVAEVQQDAETVRLYMEPRSWSQSVTAAARQDLRTLPRATIEQRIQDDIYLPEGWGNDDAQA